MSFFKYLKKKTKTYKTFTKDYLQNSLTLRQFLSEREAKPHHYRKATPQFLPELPHQSWNFLNLVYNADSHPESFLSPKAKKALTFPPFQNWDWQHKRGVLMQ